MFFLSVALIFTSLICLISSFYWNRARAFFLVATFFLLFNSFIAAPLNWQSLLKGHGFFLGAIKPVDPPKPIKKLALAIDSPTEIIRKMGCYVCHKIPYFPLSRESNYGPVLMPGSTAHLMIETPEYKKQINNGTAKATTAREYIIESILDPSAFILPGYQDRLFPERSPMYLFYNERFTQAGLEILVDYLLTLDADDAMDDGLIIGHR